MSPSALKAKIYGARGSLPNPSRSTLRFGGATTCLGVETPEGIPIIIDGGSGIFDLGLDLCMSHECHREAHLFFTHTHWDHIQGLPFFVPFYEKDWVLHIYSLGERLATVRDIFVGVYAQRFFPVPFEQLEAKIVFHELKFEDHVEIGSTTVRCHRVNHPGFALGFKLSHGGRSFFFASDAAPFKDMLFGDRFHTRERETDQAVLTQMDELQRSLEAEISGVELLFHDANYTDEEYKKLFHYGHASLSQACDLAKRCGARWLVLWHHDRSRNDDEVERICAPYRTMGERHGLIVEPARQGASYVLPLGSSEILSL